MVHHLNKDVNIKCILSIWHKNSLKIPNGLSEAVNQGTDKVVSVARNNKSFYKNSRNKYLS
jgi:hypothetical protein